MRLKVTPPVTTRYWVAISIASICGTNLGDAVPDVLGLGAGAGLAMLAVLFALVVVVERTTGRGREAFYWLAILIVRAAATNVADLSVGQAHLGYVVVSAALAVLLVGLVGPAPRTGVKLAPGTLPPANGRYWLTMLVAGSLGTVIGDGVGHAFGPVSVGVPISAVLASVGLFLVLGARARLAWRSAASYWTAVVAVRWWGTNVGDVLAFTLSLGVSTLLSAAVLLVTLWLWSERGPTECRERAPAV